MVMEGNTELNKVDCYSAFLLEKRKLYFNIASAPD